MLAVPSALKKRGEGARRRSIRPRLMRPPGGNGAKHGHSQAVRAYGQQ